MEIFKACSLEPDRLNFGVSPLAVALSKLIGPNSPQDAFMDEKVRLAHA